MQKSIFEHRNYKSYLKQWVERPGRRRGERSRMAEALRCHTAYISQVLNGHADFSLEQGALLNRHLEHSADESHFFLLLLQLARAGNAELRDYFQKQIDQVHDSRMVLKNRLEVNKALSKEDQMTFYSSWHYGAIHVLISVPQFQTKESLAHVLRLPIEKVNEMLSFLEKIGLAVQDGLRWKMGTSSVFIDSSSPMIGKHHTNWRIQAMQSLDRLDIEDLHYSAPISLSKDDFQKIREMFVDVIRRAREIVKPSKEEIAACYCLDLFKIQG